MSYGKALAVLLVMQGLYFNRVLVDHDVIYAIDNRGPVGAPFSQGHRLQYWAFSDQSDQFIPELYHHLHGNPKGWLSTWNPHTELGRPSFQLAGLGKANLITNLLSLFTHDPFRLYTIFCVLTVSLSGVFFFAFLWSLRLAPPACLCASAGLSMGVYNSTWLTFPMYISTICWSTALLWLVHLFINRRQFAVAAGISFATYNLLMAGYPQFIVFQAYLLIGFGLVQLARSHMPAKERLLTMTFLAAAALTGAALASPAYLDLVLNSSLSSRPASSDDYVMAHIARTAPHGILQIARALSLAFDTLWFGNPMLPGYPFPYPTALKFSGMSFTPLFGSLLFLSPWAGRWREVWLWHAFCLTCLIAAFWTPVHTFAVSHLGFNLSQFNMLSGAIIPGFVLCGYTADRILHTGLRPAILACAVLPLPLIAGMWAFRGDLMSGLHPKYVLLACAIVAGTGAFVWTRNPRILEVLVCVSIIAYGYQLILSRPLEEICRTSDLVEGVRAQTDSGSRYVRCGGCAWDKLRPNEECMLGVRSLHTYNPMASRNYGRLLSRINNKFTADGGRYCGWLDGPPSLESPEFSYCGVGVILTQEELDSTRYLCLGRYGACRLYRPLVLEPREAQLSLFTCQRDNEVMVAGPLHAQPLGQVRVLESFDDYKKYYVAPCEGPTLLFLSQQYHPLWKARSTAGPLQTVLVNDFFQGVIIPPKTDLVQIEFRPWSRWAWLPQLLYLVTGAACVVITGLHWWPRTMQVPIEDAPERLAA
jgi:hypothetical protein